MKRVLYSVSDLLEWVSIAEFLETEYDWKPVYWLTVPTIDGLVGEKYPNIEKQCFFDINKQRFNRISNFGLDDKLLKDFSQCIFIANMMLDRYDVFGSFAAHERREYIYTQLQYWFETIGDLQIDTIILSEAPHSVAQYILYSIGLFLNIKIILFKPTHFCSLTYIDNRVDSVRDDLLMGENLEPLSKCLRYKLTTLRKDSYPKNIPWYMGKKKNKIGFNFLLEGFKKFFSIRETYYLKRRNKKIRNSSFRGYDVLAYKLRSNIYKYRLKLKYKSISINYSAIKKPYLYFPLHYQPEKTTCPEGSFYNDQYLIINMLVELLPEGWIIVVKEHPQQFARKMKGQQGRYIDYYENFLKYPNVYFIKMDSDQFTVIDNCKAVITITGTVGIEAVARGIPSIIFGYPWYDGCEGVFSGRNKVELKKSLELINKGYIIDQMKVDMFFKRIQRISKPVYLNPSTRLSDVEISFNQNLENIKTLLEKFIVKSERSNENL